MIRLLLLTIYLFYSNYVHSRDYPEGIKCSFTEENSRNGKSNQASCSNNPDKMFSTNDRQIPSNQHCDVDSTYDMDEFRNLFVDFKKNTVSYTWHSQLSDWGKKNFIESQISKGENIKNATKKANHIAEKKLSYPIDKIFFTEQVHLFDPITDEIFLKEEDYIFSFSYNIVFDNSTLVVNKESSSSTIIKVSSGASSIVRMRFGKCRIIYE